MKIPFTELSPEIQEKYDYDSRAATAYGLTGRCSQPLAVAMTSSQRYEVRPRKDHRGVDLISDALPFGRLWYGEPNAISYAIGYAKFRSRSHDPIILGALRREENLTCVRIFNFGSGRKTADIDVTAV